jgi:muramoyltetrapeptide carboxypeptidase LdcA involved in peptidoglycan recycling
MLLYILADLNDALRDPAIRGLFATRGGKGAYRIADQIDLAAVRRDPKPLIGFSDATILHLALWRCAEVVSIHGPDTIPFGAMATLDTMTHKLTIAGKRTA